MAEMLIRMASCGFELNFGTVVVGELDGIKFVIEDWRAEPMGIKYEEPEEIPAFIDDLKLVVHWGASAQVYVFPFNKEDIKPLGVALSKLCSDPVCRVNVSHHSRNLMAWENGEVVWEQRTIDHFYSGMTEAEIERSRF
ncbi:hypothetical protein D3C81_190640 [compost metagenome]